VGDEAESHGITGDYGEHEADDRPRRVAESLADGLSDDDRDKERKSEEKAVRDEETGDGRRRDGQAPAQIEGAQKGADDEDDEEEKSLQEGEEESFHGVASRDEFSASSDLRRTKKCRLNLGRGGIITHGFSKPFSSLLG